MPLKIGCRLYLERDSVVVLFWFWLWFGWNARTWRAAAGEQLRNRGTRGIYRGIATESATVAFRFSQCAHTNATTNKTTLSGETPKPNWRPQTTGGSDVDCTAALSAARCCCCCLCCCHGGALRRQRQRLRQLHYLPAAHGACTSASQLISDKPQRGRERTAAG